MILYILHFYLIFHLFVAKRAEPIMGENVWPANPQDFTFIASLGFTNPISYAKRSHFCGGSLITKRHVLTAAHCLENVSINKVDVIIGEVNLAVPSPRYKVDGWIMYTQWAEMHKKRIEPLFDDLAIVVLQTTVDRPGIKPVALTDLNGEQLHGTIAVMAGWGDTITGSVPKVLLRARVTILTPQECSKKIELITNEPFYLGKTYLCSWAEPYVLTGCGDSGGPLLDQNNVLLGVVSGKCPNETLQWGNFPVEFLNQYKVNLYASVDYYRDFIESQTSLKTRRRKCR